jgi:alpha-N-arabinofuranosidase
MAQGTHVTRNLLHDNLASEDLFVEVDHGPFLVDNNIFLSPRALLVNSQGGACAHNLMVGTVRVIHTERRETPYHPPHSTVVAGLHGNPSGDDRYYNNLMAQQTNLTPYDTAAMPVFMSGNVFVGGAKPSKHESSPLVAPDFDPGIGLVEKADGFYLDITFDKSWTTTQRKLITTELLGKAKISAARYENPNGSPLKVDTDYFGKRRSGTNPTPGPFENPGEGALKLRVW